MKKILIAIYVSLSVSIAFGEKPKEEETEPNIVEEAAEDTSGGVETTQQERIVWNPPKEPVPTANPPKNWKIEVFREKKFNHSHTLTDGTVVTVDVTPFILTPSNPRLIYFLEPGYSPDKGQSHSLVDSIKIQNQAIDTSIQDLRAISDQLEKLREWIKE